MSPLTRATVTVGAVLVVALAVLAPSAAARLVRVGSVPPLTMGTRLLGPLPAATRVHVTVALRPRHDAALMRAALSVATPGSAAYHAYLTPGRFARRYGASEAELRAVDSALRAQGLAPGRASANRLEIPVTATAGALARAFSIVFSRVRLPDGTQAVLPSLAPALNADVAGDVTAVIGLSSLAHERPMLRRPGRLAGALTGEPARSAHSVAHVATGGPQPCAAATSAGGAAGAYTADQIASAYGFSGLYRDGDEGAGVTIALYELEPDDPADIAAYQACYGTKVPVSYVPVDGGAGSGPGAGEAALDIEQVIGLAPKADVIVYQGPNSNANGPGSGPFDTLAAIVDADRAQVVSTSWGACEADEGAADARAESTLLAQAALQGQTILAAAGDSGSEDCDDGSPLPDTALAVDDPGSQPFVTSVGGTSLTAPGPPPTETTWNNGGNLGALVGLEPGAGGGGISTLWTMPAFQSGAAASLHVIQADSSGAPCGASRGDCREVPDVSADADPDTGYVIYYNGAGTEVGAPSGWQSVGGTSASAPLWGALVGLADASRTCAGVPVGFADPGLYRAAGADEATAFHDVTSGDNDFTGSNGGRFPALPGYDMATGLGSPDAAVLGPLLCADSLRLRDPGPTTSALHSVVHLALRDSDAAHERVTLTASGLPPGLRLARGAATIGGRPARRGTYTVRIAAADSGGAAGGTVFTWTIAGPPRLSGVTLRATGAGAPRLALRASVSHGAPALRVLSIRPPGGLRFAARPRGIVVTGARGRRVRYRASVSGGVLRLRLASPAPSVTVSIGPAGLAAVASPARISGRLRVSVTDASGGVSSLSARARGGR